jgi:hypothetical protein
MKGYSWLTVLIAPKPDKRRADTPTAMVTKQNRTDEHTQTNND